MEHVFSQAKYFRNTAKTIRNNDCTKNQLSRPGQGTGAIWQCKSLQRNRNTSTKGGVLLQLVVIWLPILGLFALTLWIRAASLFHLKQQRDLDRCMYSILQTRCKVLSQVSGLNAKLKKLIHTVSALRMASLLPGAGTAALVAYESASKVAKPLAKAIARLQDRLLEYEKIKSRWIWRCGFAHIVDLSIARLTSVESQTVGMPAPLSWIHGPGDSKIDVKRWDFQKRCYGYCKGDSRLNGEKYKILFRLPLH